MTQIQPANQPTQLVPGTLEEHEQAAMNALEQAIDSTTVAYYHLAIIRYADLWKDAVNEDGVQINTWQEYLSVFSGRLSDRVRGGTGKSTLEQRLRDYARYHIWAGIDADTALSLPPSAANELSKVGTWESRGTEDEGALREWTPGVKENVKRFLGTEEEEDKALVGGLVRAIHAMPEGAKETIRNQILRKPEEEDLFEWGVMYYSNLVGARVTVTWERVDAGGNVVETWRGDPQSIDAPMAVVQEYARKLGVFLNIQEEG